MNTVLKTSSLKKNLFIFLLLTISYKNTHTITISQTCKTIAKIGTSFFIGTTILTPALLYILHNKTSLPYKNITHPWSNKFTAEKHSINDQYYYHIQKKEPIENNLSQETIFVHLHGFGDHPIALACSQDGPLFPSNDYYAICFEDAAQNKLFKSSIGQKTDIITTLTILLYISKHYSSICFIAHSRGAAALINTIAILNQANHELLELLDISELERITLLKKIKNGAMILKAPLIHTKTLMQNALGHFWGNIFEKIILPPLTGFRYLSQEMQAIESIDQLYYISIPTLICFPEYDQILGDSMNELFTKKFTRINGEGNTHIYTYTGDHIGSSDKKFRELTHHFLKYKQKL